jgi:hypothetical protein
MPEDARRAALRDSAVELLALESDLEAAIDSQREIARAYADVSAAVERFRAQSAQQRDALRGYVETIEGVEARPAESAVAALFNGAEMRRERPLTDVLRADYAAFNYAAISYAALFEMALRLYEPPLRELAPKHMRAHAEAAQTINQLIAGIAAAELAEAGLECHCICPMCGLGACGCVSLGMATVNQAWRETGPAGEAPAGFALQPPRAESQLALAGVQGGERLLEVGGQQVSGIGDIQAAIRKHAIGEEFVLRVQRGPEAPREIRVRHVSDYPQT